MVGHEDVLRVSRKDTADNVHTIEALAVEEVEAKPNFAGRDTRMHYSVARAVEMESDITVGAENVLEIAPTEGDIDMLLSFKIMIGFKCLIVDI